MYFKTDNRILRKELVKLIQKQLLLFIQIMAGPLKKTKPSPKNLNNDWPDSQYKSFISVYDPINCFDKENEISNNNLILNLLGCLSNKKNIYFENNNKKYSYYLIIIH